MQRIKQAITLYEAMIGGYVLIMIRVGLITNEFFPVWGGVSTYCINLCRGLVDQVELHVFTIMKKDQDLDSLFCSYPALRKIKFHSITNCNPGVLSTLRFQLSSLLKLPRLIDDNKIDIIHTSTFLADALYRWLGIKVPNVLTVHTTINGQVQGFLKTGTNIKDLDPSEWFTLGAYPFLRVGELTSLCMAPHVIAVSNSVARELEEASHYKGKYYVIHNGVDLEVFSPSHQRLERPKRILFVGRIIATKGIGTLINAIPFVLKFHPDAVFVFAGSGRNDPYIELLKRLGISEANYQFRQVEYGLMGDLYRDSDIFVLPSYTESCPMSILEAAASGLPVISSNIKDIPLLVRHGTNGFLLSPGDYQSLGKYLNTLLDNEELRHRMGISSRQIAEECFSYKKMGLKTLEVYKKVVGLYESRSN